MNFKKKTIKLLLLILILTLTVFGTVLLAAGAYYVLNFQPSQTSPGTQVLDLFRLRKPRTQRTVPPATPTISQTSSSSQAIFNNMTFSTLPKVMGNPPRVTLSAGNAPHSIYFSIAGAERAKYKIYFGDGESAEVVSDGSVFKIGHSYKSEGTYGVRLVVFIGTDEKQVWSATIKVDATTISVAAATSSPPNIVPAVTFNGAAWTITWSSNASQGSVGFRLVRIPDGFRCLIGTSPIAAKTYNAVVFVGSGCMDSGGVLTAGQYDLVLTYPYKSVSNQGEVFGASPGQQPPVITLTK